MGQYRFVWLYAIKNKLKAIIRAFDVGGIFLGIAR